MAAMGTFVIREAATLQEVGWHLFYLLSWHMSYILAFYAFNNVGGGTPHTMQAHPRGWARRGGLYIISHPLCHQRFNAGKPSSYSTCSLLHKIGHHGYCQEYEPAFTVDVKEICFNRISTQL